MCLCTRTGAKGQSSREPTFGDEGGVRKMIASCDRDGIAEAHSRLMLPLVLSPMPGEGISAGFGFPHVSKVLQGAPMGKDVEKPQELPVNSTRGRHDTRQKRVYGAGPVGVGLARPCHLGACRGLEELVDIAATQLPVAAHVPEAVASELVGAC